LDDPLLSSEGGSIASHSHSILLFLPEGSFSVSFYGKSISSSSGDQSETKNRTELPFTLTLYEDKFLERHGLINPSIVQHNTDPESIYEYNPKRKPTSHAMLLKELPGKTVLFYIRRKFSFYSTRWFNLNLISNCQIKCAYDILTLPYKFEEWRKGMPVKFRLLWHVSPETFPKEERFRF
jgi:hypothetical protein